MFSNGFERPFNVFRIELIVASHALSNFSNSLVSGNWVLNGFFDGIQAVGSSALAFAEGAFKEAATLEVDRIAGGGAISSGFDNKVDFGQGLEIFDTVRTKLAGIAADLPGVTAEYTKAAALLGDDIAGALNNGRRSAEELKQAFETKTPELIKNLVLNSKLYGQDIPLSSITRSFSTFLETGKIAPKEIFFQRNPLLKATIARYEKDNGKLTGMSKDKRIDAITEIFSKTFSSQQMDMLKESFTTRFESLRSAVTDPDVGLFGFNRKITGIDGQATTFFGVLSKAVAPFLDALTEGAKLLTQFADPLQAIGGLIEMYVTPKIKALSLSIARGFDEGVNFVGTPFEKLRAGIQSAFDIDIKKIDVAAEITKFFDVIANAIRNFGRDNTFTKNKAVDDAINALIDGIGNVIMAIIDRMSAEFAKDPVKFVKFAFFFNPSAVINFTVLIAALLPFLGYLGTAIQFVAGAFMSVLGAPVIAIAAFVAGIVIFRKNIDDLAQKFMTYTGFMSGFVNFLGIVMSMFGKAGQAFYDAIQKLLSGDWTGAIVKLFEGLLYVLGGVVYTALSPFVALFDLLGNALKGLLNVVIGLGTKLDNWIVGFISGIVGAVDKYLIQPLMSLVSGITDLFAKPTAQQASPTGLGSVASKMGNFAGGNPVGNSLLGLLTGYAAEKQAMPAGAQVVFANTSEAIMPQAGQAQLVSLFTSEATRYASAGLSSITNFLAPTSYASAGSTTTAGASPQGPVINMTVNNYGNEDITQKVINALESVLNG